MSINSARAFIERLKTDTVFRERITKASSAPKPDKKAGQTPEVLRLARSEGFDFDEHDMCEARKDLFSSLLGRTPFARGDIKASVQDLGHTIELLAVEARFCGNGTGSFVCGGDAQR